MNARQVTTSAPFPSTGAAGPDARGRRVAGIALIVLLVALAVLRSQAGTRLDGWTVDEPWHVVAGESYQRTGDFRLNPEHPPLVKLAVAVAVPDDFALRPPAVLTEKSQERELVEETMFFDNRERGDATQAAARRGMWAVHALLLLALGAGLWRASGLPWAAGTLAFLALEPSIGAHLPVVMTDLPLALTFGVSAVAAGVLCATWRWPAMLATGFAFGLMLGAKHSALAGAGGLALVLAAGALAGVRRGGARELGRRALLLVLAAALSIVVLWSQYGFRFHAGPDGSDAFNRTMSDKIADLNLPAWRAGIAFADEHRLLPRAYLWGLADTVRAGVEGRGQAAHWVWGVLHKGEAPWYTWPSVVVVKMPLALLALALLGLVLGPLAAVTPAARWTLAAVGVGAAAHLLALMGSQGTYGGVRHALPIVVALAVFAGGAIAFAWRRRSRITGAAVAALLVATGATTFAEPRLWEYHNELVGGTRDAHWYFRNEGLDLGQRFREMRAFHDEFIVPGGEPMFANYWFGEKQAIAQKMAYRRRILGMEDTNAAGVYEGWFFDNAYAEIPQPDWNWDPETAFRETRVVARLGHVVVRHGRMVDPQGRADSMYGAVIEYRYRKDGDDDRLVAARLQEVVDVFPMHAGAGIELGNAWLRLGDTAKARAAYAGLLEQQQVPLEALIRGQVERQVALIDAGTPASAIAGLRNPWME